MASNVTVRYLVCVPELRSAFLEFDWRDEVRPGLGIERKLLFSGIHADCAGLPTDVSWSGAKASTLRAAWVSLFGDFHCIEISEPLWLKAWPRACVIAFAARLGGAFRRRQPIIWCYAIENQSTRERLGSGGLLMTLAARCSSVLLGLTTRLLSGMVFGSPGAWEAYSASLRLPGKCETVVMPASLAPCVACIPEAVDARAEVVFVAEFAERKGIRELLEAWTLLGDQSEGWRLRLFGYGVLLELVQSWADERDDVDVVVGASRQEIHEAYTRASVAVLPSKTVKGWREQVGIPILEGIAHSCAIVASSDSGVGDLLKENGHDVVRPGDIEELLAALARNVGAGPRRKERPSSLWGMTRGEIEDRIAVGSLLHLGPFAALRGAAPYAQ